MFVPVIACRGSAVHVCEYACECENPLNPKQYVSTRGMQYNNDIFFVPLLESRSIQQVRLKKKERKTGCRPLNFNNMHRSHMHPQTAPCFLCWPCDFQF